MAGKHTGAFSPFPDGSAAVPGFEWSPRTTKAYAEGRGGVIDNGHPAGSDASLAWTAGAANSADAAYQFETAIFVGVPLHAQTTLVINRITANGGSLSGGEITRMDEFIRAQVSAGNWANVQNFYNFTFSDTLAARTDWIGGTLLTVSGSPTHDTGGYYFPSQSDFLTLAYVSPVTDIPHYWSFAYGDSLPTQGNASLFGSGTDYRGRYASGPPPVPMNSNISTAAEVIGVTDFTAGSQWFGLRPAGGILELWVAGVQDATQSRVFALQAGNVEVNLQIQAASEWNCRHISFGSTVASVADWDADLAALLV